eukprot:230330_1
MGNEHSMYGFSGHGYGGGWGINRSGWAAVSEGAKQRLEIAKQQFRDHVKLYSFANVNKHYEFTKKHAIKLHLVGKLRPKFNTYVKQFGAKPKWVKLTEQEKRNISKHKNRKSAIYFCDLTIDGNVICKLREQEPNEFKQEYLIQEISLFTCLVRNGVPEIDALGWIVKVPKNQKIEQIPKINNLNVFLSEKMSEMKLIAIESTNEYKTDPKVIKRKNKKKKKITPSKGYNRNTNNKKRKYDNDSDDEYMPPSHKRRKY